MADSPPPQSSEMSTPSVPDMASQENLLPPKARYRGPRADKDTFETQEEFLNSLETIPIESVEHRRCPHCWKDYGESDPGFDNAEAPVKLRCSHVFGEKCLRDLFGLPERVKVDMVPLSYAPGSNGADLGQRLSKWVSHCGVDKGALLIGGNREKDFTKLVSEVFQSTGSRNRQLVVDTLGESWFTRFHSILESPGSYRSRKIDEVHILENAIIMDSGVESIRAQFQMQQEIAKLHQPTVMHYHYPPAPSNLPPSFGLAPDLLVESSPFDESVPYLVGAPSPFGESFPDTLAADWHVYQQAILEMNSFAQAEAGQAAAIDAHFALEDGQPTTLASPGAMPTSESEGKVTSNATGPEDGGDNTKEKSPKHALAQKILKIQAKFEGVQHLPKSLMEAIKKTNANLVQGLEKVQNAKSASTPSSSKGKKLTTSKPVQQQIEEQQAKLTKILQLMDNPLLAQYIPASITNPVWLTDPTSETPVEPMKPSQAFMKLHGFESEEENVALTKMVALKKFAKKTWKTAEAKKTAAEKKQEQLKERNLMMTAQRDAQIKSLTVTLVDTLKTIYQDYEQFMYEQALAAGQPPPVKKLRLVSSTADPVAFPVTTPSPPEPQSPSNSFMPVHISIAIHELDIDAKYYNVQPPFVDGGDPSDSEYADEEAEAPPVKDRKIYFITRMRCTHCASDNGRSDVGEPPEYITWSDEKNVPDGCPICRKVLFKKQAKR